MSFLALYNRIFPPPIINRFVLWGTAAFIVIYTIVIMFIYVCKTLMSIAHGNEPVAELTGLQAFECDNPSDAWLPSFPSSGDCMDLRIVYYSSAAVNILTDLAVLAIPLQPLFRLNINRRRKCE